MIVLHGINLSTFTRKVRLALDEKGIAYRFESSPMGSPRVRALNPLGRIPVLEHSGLAIPDSSVIIAYLERLYPDPPLYPAVASDLARALWLEEYADTRLREATLPFFAEQVVKPLFMGRPGDVAALQSATPLRDESFAYLDRELGAGEFAIGEVFTVADIAIGTQLLTYEQAGEPLDPARWPRLAAWFERVCARVAWEAMAAGESAALDQARQRKRPAD